MSLKTRLTRWTGSQSHKLLSAVRNTSLAPSSGDLMLRSCDRCFLLSLFSSFYLYPIVFWPTPTLWCPGLLIEKCVFKVVSSSQELILLTLKFDGFVYIQRSHLKTRTDRYERMGFVHVFREEIASEVGDSWFDLKSGETDDACWAL